MSIESALRELGKEIQKDERFVALQVAAKHPLCSANG